MKPSPARSAGPAALLSMLLLLAACAPAPTEPPPATVVVPIVLAITVTDMAGVPLSGVHVVVDHFKRHRTSGVTDEDGRFDAHVISALLHDLYASRDSLAGYHDFDILGADLSQPVPVTLELREAVVVRGVARLAGRSDHSGIDVQPLHVPFSARTGRDGSWSIAGWPAGRFSAVSYFALGFGFDAQYFTTGAPGETMTLPTITLVSDPGGTRARQP